MTTAQRMILDELQDADSDEIDTLINGYLEEGYNASFLAALGDTEEEVEDEEDDEDPTDEPARSRLDKLRDTVDDLKGNLFVGVAMAVGVALLTDNPTKDIGAALDDRAGIFAVVELTAATTAGALDSAAKQHLAYVRITATPECEFCQGYEGRILALDEDDGMPPLHNGCQCDIEPLD